MDVSMYEPVDLGVIKGLEAGITIEEESFNVGFKTLSSSMGMVEEGLSTIDFVVTGFVISSSILVFKYKLFAERRADVDVDSLSVFIYDNEVVVVVVGVVVVVVVGVIVAVVGAIGVEVEVEEIVPVRVGVEEEREAFSDEDNNGSKLAIEVIADNVDASDVVDRETGVVKEEVDISVDNNEDS